MSFRGFLRPGQGFSLFSVLTRDNRITATGRPVTDQLVKTGEIFGILTQTSPREAEQWKQSGHPVTHTIVQRGTAGGVKETDVLELGGENPRRFLVQTMRNPGNLGHFTVYKVEERKDLG